VAAVAVEIRSPSGPGDWDAFGALVREYLQSLPFDVDFQDVDDELAELDRRYAPPEGEAFIAWHDGQAVGVVGVRPFGEDDGEMKRMYVVPAARGLGAGRALAHAAVESARGSGHRRLLLDTVATLTEAIALYRSMGFEEIDAYRFNPRPDARYFALVL
jgi:GNAT superfamily N-acetyltransferase